MSYRACEVCGSAAARLVLRSPRLDGPLVRCPDCGLVFVGQRARDFTFASADVERTQALGDLVDELGIVAREVEALERGRRSAAEAARVERLRGFVVGGSLLDVGSATGAFLAAAGDWFDAEGVEPDPGTSALSREAGLRVRTGTLGTVPVPPEGEGFDVVTMFHVVEHLDSPREALLNVRALLRPGGVVVIETPTVDNLWFRVAPARWRQLIPDHYFFFSASTLGRLLRECGFVVVDDVKVGRRVSVRFAVDRLRRAGVPGAGFAAACLDRAGGAVGFGDRSVYLNPGDIMQIVARAV